MLRSFHLSASLLIERTLLSFQAGSEDESLITFLVQTHTADVNIRDHYGMTPLHYAASKGNLTAVKELLQCDQIAVDVSLQAITTVFLVGLRHRTPIGGLGGLTNKNNTM